MTMFTITINGETKSFPTALTVAELVERLGSDSSRVAVEVNREVVPRAAHAAHHLAAGDAVEIVTLVGGGAC
jgi:thiamine biosynthesis protein ThiS